MAKVPDVHPTAPTNLVVAGVRHPVTAGRRALDAQRELAR
jgi:hypothetical protein